MQNLRESRRVPRVPVNPRYPTREIPRVRPLLWRIVGAIGVLLMIAALIALAVSVISPARLWIDHAQTAIEYPYPLNYGEGPLLDQAARLARGAPIYRADVLINPPHVIANYPPLYPMLIAAVMPLMSGSVLEPSDAARAIDTAVTPAALADGLTAGRLISLASIGLATLALAAILYGVTRDPIAMAAALLLPLTPYTLHWAALARVDTLALALSLSGLAVIVMFPRGRVAWLGAIALMLGAAYTRQTALLSAPLAATAYLIARGQGWRALSFAAWLGAIALILFAVTVAATGGGFFLHLITANVNALDGRILQTYADEFARVFPVLIPLWAALLVVGAIARVVARLRRRPYEFGAAWALVLAYSVGAVVNLLTIAKIGSDVNYLYEAIAALLLAAGVGIGAARRLPVAARGWWRAAIIGALAVQVVIAGGWSADKYAPILINRAADDSRRHAEALIRVIDDANRQGSAIVADEAIGLLAMRGAPIAVQPFELAQLASAGAWDERAFVAALARGDYPLVLMYQPAMNPSLRFERWTPAMLRAINDHFRPAPRIGDTAVYVWRE